MGHFVPCRVMCVALVVTAGSILPLTSTARAQGGAPTVGVPWAGPMGITETVEQIMGRHPRIMPPRPPRPEHERHPVIKRQNPDALPGPSFPWNGALPRLGPGGGVLDNPQTIGLQFQGAQYSDAFYAVPDTVGAVGPSQIMVCPNGTVRALTKTGAPGPLNTFANSFFNSVRAGSDVIDPQVRFDRTSQRWIVSGITDASPNRVCFAVSNGPVITAASSFTFFYFQQDLVGPTPNQDTGAFADYDSLGVDANAVYIGCNMFNPGYAGSSAWVVRKSSILGAGPIVVTAFRQVANFATDGPDSPRGVDNDDPTATEGYFIGPSLFTFSRLSLRRITNPGGTPSISPSLFVDVPGTVFPMQTPALGSVAPLDAIDDRCFAAAIRKNRYTGLQTLWTAHHIQVNSQGSATNSGGRNGARWYELRDLTTTPALRQAGTVYDPSPSNPRSFWMPSITMSGQGHAALGCSVAGNVDYAGAVTAGRLSTDPLGTLQTPTTIIPGASSYNNLFGLEDGSYRWGDYSTTVVDPVDDQTIWTFQEYCNATDSWGIRVAKLVAPPPATPLSCNPATVPQGVTNFAVVLTGAAVAGSGFFDTLYPEQNRVQASVAGTGVTVDNIAFNSPTQLTLFLTVINGAAGGARDITITNPDGQSASSSLGILNIGTGALNDSCAFATPISEGQVPFSTVGASTDGPPEATCGLGADPQINQDLWYFYVASCSGPATVSLCGTTFDSRIAVYEGVCPAGPGTAIACNDNSCGQSARVTWPAVFHHLYTIRIGGTGTATGSGLFTLSCSPCYANCDGSSIAPVLTVNDFTCFLNRFAAGHSYANCDNSTTPPVLNVADFTCFLNRFAAGCQ